MHANIPADIDGLSFPELDDLRHNLRLSQKAVCKEADIDQSTYTRWRKGVRGEDGGTCPHKRSLRALRQVLAKALAERMAAASGTASTVSMHSNA